MSRANYAIGTPAACPFETELNGLLNAVVGMTVAIYDLAAPTVPITAGITTTQNVNGVTGSHLSVVDTSNPAYGAGKSYCLRATAGTVAGSSIVGMILYEGFDLQNQYMRGTDNAALATSLASLIATVAALNNLSLAQAATACATALTAYAAQQPTESYGALHAVPTRDQFQFMILALLSTFAYVGTNQSVKGVNGSTEEMTFAIDSATRPTSHTRTS